MYLVEPGITSTTRGVRQIASPSSTFVPELQLAS